MIKVVFCKGEEVVYCKDCVHRPYIDKVYEWVQCPEDSDGGDDEKCPFICEDIVYSKIMEDNFYCAYGEKK